MSTTTHPAVGISVASFRQLQDRLAVALERVQRIASELGAMDFVTSLQLTLRDLVDNKFQLVVVGDFSRGKSTIINAILGQRLLPSGMRPITAVLTRIRRAERDSFRLIYQNGETKEITSEQFKDLVAPKDPPPDDEKARKAYEAQIAALTTIGLVEVDSASPFWPEGIDIVDTPGTNDLDVMREKITNDFVPSADSVIVVLSARMPLSRSELDFVRDRIVEADIAGIFFLINHADGLSENERLKVIEYVREHLEPVVADPRVYLVCGKAALGHRIRAAGGEGKGAELMPFERTGFTEFEHDLSSFLRYERTEAKLSRPRSRGLRTCRELREGPLGLAISLVGVDLPSLEQQLQALDPKIKAIEQERDRVLSGLRTGMLNHQLEIAQALRSEMEAVANAAVQAVTSYTGPLTKEQMLQHLEHNVAPNQASMQKRIRAMQERALQEEYDRAQRRLEMVRQDLFEDIQLVVPKWADTIDVERIHADQHGGVLMNASMGGLGIAVLAVGIHLFLPLALVAGALGGGFIYDFLKEKKRAQVLGKVRIQVDRRFRDLIAPSVKDFSERWQRQTDTLINTLKSEFDRNLQGIRAQFDQVLADHAKASTNAVDRRAELLQHQSELQACEREFRSINVSGRSYDL
jgi:GTPase SAR1 family protein